MNGLRFCMITTFYPPYSFGGDAIGIQRLSRALVKRGHEVTVIFDRDAFDMLSHGVRRPDPEPDGVKVIGLRSRFGSVSEFLTHQTGRPVVHRGKLQRILNEGNFDVLTYHNISLIGGPGILSMGRGLKIYMAHEHWLVCPSHILWRHGRELCDARECTRCVLHYGRPPQFWRHTGYMARQLAHVDAFIAMSDFSRQKHAEFGFQHKMEVVPYFLPAVPAPETETGPPHNRPYFLFVGRLEQIKGLDDVIPLFRKYPNADLLIAGDGEHEAVLRAKAEGIPNVQFLGRLKPEELNRYYRNAIALIVPSVCFETFGIILIEAFRQATPVIAREIGPFPEIVRSSGGGLLFRTSQELLDAMKRLQENPEARAEMGKMGYDGFLKYWTEEAVLPAYLEIVRKAAGQKNIAAITQVLSQNQSEVAGERC